jgi:hypothetical protein
MATSFLATLSIGYLADRLAHAVDWSPVAKSVSISGAEGPAAGLFEGMTGTVLSVEESALIVEPDRKAHPAVAVGSHLRLTARHRGWTPYSLFLRPIAVVVEVEPPDGRPGAVAIAVATVIRQGYLSTRD